MRFARWTARLKSLARAARTVAGAPDYERYLAHLRAHHPGTPPLTPDEFQRRHLRDRYERPGARCC